MATPPPPPTSLYERTAAAAAGLADPWVFLWTSLSYAPSALRATLSRGGGSEQRETWSWSRFRDVWFGQFWAAAGSGLRASAEASVAALLDGRTSGGRVVAPPAAPAGPGIGGTVLEIGAGAGIWVDMYDDRGRELSGSGSGSGSGRTRIERVYGVEPNPDQHANLRRAVARQGLEDVYEIVPVRIQDLGGGGGEGREKKWDGRIEKGSLDCIVSMLCMCSIPDPEANARELYAYLKEGGRWYAYEHVRCEYSWYMRLYQRFVNLFWPHLIGGCQLCRPTEKTLRECGPWSRVDVGQPPDEQWYRTVPHIVGVFTK